MNCITSIQSAIKAKSPVVAVSVPGRAPFCLDRKRLAGWAKRVTILSAEVVQAPDSYYAELEALESHWHHGKAEGPRNMVLRTVKAPRTLKITGRDGRVKTSASFIPIERREALKIISVWSEKERAKLQKKIMLGALGKDHKKALKLAKLGDEGLDTVKFAERNGTFSQRTGVLVSIPDLPEFSFYAVMIEEKQWSITEASTGVAAGKGDTAEYALIDAIERIRRVGADTAKKMIQARMKEQEDATQVQETALQAA